MGVIKLKRGNNANLASLTLQAGEPAFTLDTGKLYIGDGTDKILINPDSMPSADVATKLATARLISVTGDGTGSSSFDGSAPASITLTLANTGVSAGTYTKVTVDAKGRITSATTLSASDIPTLDHNKISDFDTQVRLSRLDQMAAPNSSVSMNSQKITNLATPTLGTDAVNKDYVDAARAGLSIKDPVRVASTANIVISTGGLLTVDGVTLVAGDRVLLKNQTTATENGIYVVASGAWSRANDANLSSEVNAGMAVWVNEGTTNGDSRWVLTTNDPITLGTSSLTFTKDFQASDIVAGTGINKSGNTLSLTSGVATAGTYKSVTVDTYGRVTGGTNPTTLSGYGITDAATLASPTFTGTPAAPTPTTADNTTKIATTAFVKAQGYLNASSDIDGGTF